MKALPHADPVHKISIISRGMALGWTLSLPEEDKYLISKDELMDQIAGIMGGRVAEEIVFGDVTSGAENDIQKATQMARRMVTQWGMSDKLGTVTMGHKEELVFLGRDLGEQRNYSEEVAAIIDEEIRSIINHGYQTGARGQLHSPERGPDARRPGCAARPCGRLVPSAAVLPVPARARRLSRHRDRGRRLDAATPAQAASSRPRAGSQATKSCRG